MFKQALSLLTYRKKSGALLALLLAFVFFLLGSVPALFSERDRLWFENESKIRGVFDGIFFNLSEIKLGILQKSQDVGRLGLVRRYGLFSFEGTESQVSVGTFDETALDIGRLETVEGRFPENKGEAALSESLKTELPAGAGVGSNITLVTPTGRKTYTICGFVEDYIRYWVQGAEAKLQVKELPVVFVTKEGAPSLLTVETDALVYMARMTEREDASAHFVQLCQTLRMEKRYERTYNKLVYGRMSFENRVFQAAFTFVILAGVATVSYIALVFYLQNYRDVARKLYLSGASERYTLWLLYLWIGLLTVASLLIGVLLHLVFSAVMKAILDISIPLANYLPVAILVIIALARTLLLYHRRQIEPLSDASLSRQNDTVAKKAIRIKSSLQLSFAAGRAEKGKGALRILYLSMAVIFALFLCVNEDVNSRLGLTFHKGVYTFSASLEPVRTGADMQTFGDFRLTREPAGISREEVQALVDMPGVKSAKVEYMGAYPSLILKDPEKSLYSQALHRQDGAETRFLTAPALPVEWATTVDMGHFSIYVMSQKQIYILEELFPKVSSLHDFEKGEAVVFCLPIFTGRRQTVSNDAYAEGDEITFGWLSTEGELMDAVADPTLVDYHEASFQITEVITEEGYWGNKLAEDLADAGMAWDDVIVVISEETAAESGLCGYVSRVSVTMSAGVTKEAYAACKTRLEELAGDAFSMKIEESEEALVYEAETVAPVLMIQNFLAVLLSLFLLYALFLVLHDSFAQYRQSFGILRSVGCRKKWFFGTVFQEFMIYLLELAAVCFLVVLLIQTVYFPIFPYSYWPKPFEGFPYVFRTALARSGIFAAVAFVVCLLASLYFTHNLWKKSISASIRFSE